MNSLAIATLIVASRGTVMAQQPYSIFAPSDARERAAQKKDINELRVSLDVSDSTIAYVVSEVMRQTQVRMLYNESAPAMGRRVTVKLANVPLREALSEILKGTGLIVVSARDGETILIKPAEKNGARAVGTISGIVVDSATGKGIRGATVALLGSKTHTTTSGNGQFILSDVPVGDQVLSVKGIGYRVVTLPVTVSDSQRAVVRVALVQAATMLSGVLTTASGVQERRAVGTDITRLDADSIMRVAPVTSVTDLLENRVPGLIVQRTSGKPGAPSRLRLRGTNSPLLSNDPIVIVDGVRTYSKTGSVASSDVVNDGAVGVYPPPSPLDQIDPNSVETIEVFKGPSASALYGADAGNGVIVVTTKHGRAGKTRWSAALARGRSSMPGDYPVNNFWFGHIFNQASKFCNPYEACIRDSIVAFQAMNIPMFSPIGHGSRQEASTTVSGGAGIVTYSLTGSGSRDRGIMKLPAFDAQRFVRQHGFEPPGWMKRPDRYDTWGGNSNIALQLPGAGGKTGSLVFTTSLMRSIQQQSSLESIIRTLQGIYIDTTSSNVQGGVLNNGKVSDYGHRVMNKAWTSNLGVALNLPVFTWLPLEASGGISFGNTQFSDSLPRGFLVDQVYHSSPDTAGSFSGTQGSTLAQTVRLGTTLRTLGRGALPGVLTHIGFNLNNTSETSVALRSESSTRPQSPISPFVTEAKATYGWYVAPTFDLGSRLFASPGFRLDGGTATGGRAGFSGFPKLDLSWVAIDRPDEPAFGVISLLRPRIAYGIAGVQPAPNDKLRNFTLSTYQLPDGTIGSVATLNGLGNTQLRPERSREFEGGLDVDLWARRVTVSLTGYHKLRYDAILDVPAPSSVALSDQTWTPMYRVNVGTVRNTGINGTVGVRVLDTKLAAWDVNANFQKNENRLLSLGGGVFNIGGRTRLVPGYPLFGRWERPIRAYDDLNDNGLIEPNEVIVGDSAVYAGAQEPNYDVAFSTQMTFFQGRLTLNSEMNYQNGLTQELGGGSGYLSIVPGGSPALQAAYAAGLGDGYGTAKTAIGLLQTVNTLRWTSLSASYIVPKNLIGWTHTNNMSITLQGSNLGLHTNYRGKDPSVNGYADGNLTSDTGQLPLPRTWTVRVTIGN